ncbi:hypothetical protein JR316_0006344 [Psilocybe cubensis]|uniref:Uncharacterized protein n=2 Tax=Psilocybe cubensis TaxID=181762 RepID=A0A8H8CF66_PSICU|nr:hypothetical protein JR316_0006344 [Psilocybe cubensis]KAH9481817.1 hypothetical protein JR316_0006344 [Psilocybe cubensis]
MPKQVSEQSRKSSGTRRMNSQGPSVPSLQRDFSFEFSNDEKQNNPVFHTIIKPALEGKSVRRYDSPSESEQELNYVFNKEEKGGLVNGLSRWASVSSLNTESSFFLEGNLHPEVTRELSIDDPIEEEDEDIYTGSVSGRSETTERIFEDYDSRTEIGSASRYGTPASVYSGTSGRRITSSTEAEEFTAIDFNYEDDREKTPTSTAPINEPQFGYHSGTPNVIVTHSVSAPITPRRYPTRSGQVPPEKTKFRSPQKPRPKRA